MFSIRNEDLLKAQDLNKRMTDCGNITSLRQHCIDKQKLIDLITQASKAFLFLRKTNLPLLIMLIDPNTYLHD